MNLAQIQELEFKHKQFKQKKRLKFTIIAAILLFFAAGILTIFLQFQMQQNALILASQEKKILQDKLKEAKIKQEKHQILQNKNEENLNSVFNPSLMANSKIIISSQEAYIPALRKEFYAKPSYKKALRLSRIYFQNQEYKKSIFWSLKANELDKTHQDAWVMFAKAKLALGKKDEAIKALSSYMSFYDAKNFDEILSQIR